MAGNSLACISASVGVLKAFERYQLAMLVLCSASETAACCVCIRACSLTVPGLVAMLPVSNGPGDSSVLIGGRVRLRHI